MMSKLMKQIVDSKSINYLQELFTISLSYSLRSSDCFPSLPKPNTNALKRSFCLRSAAAWNNLSLSERCTEKG